MPQTIDFSQYADKPTPPPPQQGQGQLDFSQYADPVPPQDQGFWSGVGQRLQSPVGILTGAMGRGGTVATPQLSPQETAALPSAEQVKAQGQFGDAKEALKNAFSSAIDAVQHPSQLLPTWETFKAAITPKEIDLIKQGRYGEAFGTAAVDLTNLAIGGFVSPEAAGQTVSKAGQATVRGTARAVNAAVDQALVTGATTGAAIGGTVGHRIAGWPGATIGSSVGGAIGAAVGKAVQNAIPEMPGDTFGLAAAPEGYGPFSAEDLARNPNLARIVTQEQRPGGPIRGPGPAQPPPGAEPAPEPEPTPGPAPRPAQPAAPAEPEAAPAAATAWTSSTASFHDLYAASRQLATRSMTSSTRRSHREPILNSMRKLISRSSSRSSRATVKRPTRSSPTRRTAQSLARKR